MPRSRTIKILLFLIIAPFLLIGYTLYLVGDNKTKTNRKNTRRLKRIG